MNVVKCQCCGYEYKSNDEESVCPNCEWKQDIKINDTVQISELNGMSLDKARYNIIVTDNILGKLYGLDANTSRKHHIKFYNTSDVYKKSAENKNVCVLCGEDAPEGYQVCFKCTMKYLNKYIND